MSYPATDSIVTTDRIRWLRRLIVVRLVVFTVFVAAEPSTDLLVLLAAVYALSGCWFALLRLNQSHLAQAYAQIGVDLILITWMVNRTGGLDSYFSSLYFLEIVVSSLLLKRRGAYTTAVVASLLHGVHLDLVYFEIIPSTSASFPELATLQYIVGVSIFGFCAVGFLANALAEHWHASDAALEESSGQVAFLEALTTHIIDSLGSGLITTDLGGQIYLFNPSAARISGRHSEEVVGRQIQDVFPSLPQEVGTGHFEVAVEGPGGQEVCLQFSVTPLVITDSGTTGYVWSFDDVTEMREMERELRRRERMAAIGVMSAGIAHEIRNPLASITGSFGLLKADLELSAEHKQLIGIIARETERLNQTINNFLLYARPGRPQAKLFQLDVCVSDALRLIENSTARRRDHHIRTDIVPVTIRADENMIRQVVYNLASNAFKAMADGGTLTISIRKTADRARLEFNDTGVGISADDLEHLFLPFHSSFATGTGLGLSIVYQIVTAHRGQIWADSEPGEGTTVTCEFPTAPAPVTRLANGMGLGDIALQHQ